MGAFLLAGDSQGCHSGLKNSTCRNIAVEKVPAYKLALGLPNNTSTELLLQLVLHNTLDKLIEAQRQAHLECLTLTETGRHILTKLCITYQASTETNTQSQDVFGLGYMPTPSPKTCTLNTTRNGGRHGPPPSSKLTVTPQASSSSMQLNIKTGTASQRLPPKAACSDTLPASPSTQTATPS
ncbi:hypothetical protein HPB52_015704 [Rhipicephalus sanguineus]|uniref:Uncharacterized protein n=1 Tax=Rhipicephalus sanguineus TaxID=34632 RepID=A0A9D4PMS1_RHISA|nr:hypothetical protein HPB52_015704 [Rhipicephalus sanguineus]